MEANMNDEYLRMGNYRADVVFRGAQFGNLPISGWKEDFQLVPKEDEKYYIERTLPKGQMWRKPVVVPKFVELPPLLKQMLISEAGEKEIKFKEEEIKLPFVIDERDIKRVMGQK
jgi:hypothetical protein